MSPLAGCDAPRSLRSGRRSVHSRLDVCCTADRTSSRRLLRSRLADGWRHIARHRWRLRWVGRAVELAAELDWERSASRVRDWIGWVERFALRVAYDDGRTRLFPK